MKKKNVLALAMLVVGCADSFAQQIDLNMFGRNVAQVNATNYLSWQIPESKPGKSATFKAGNVQIMVCNPDSNPGNLRTNWFKGQINVDRLVNDGLHIDGNPKTPVSMLFRVTGLRPGHHNMQAFHNNVDGGVIAINPVKVEVKGHSAETKPTQRAKTTAESAYTYIEFDVNMPTDTVDFVYSSESDFYINSLGLDIVPSFRQISHPFPEDFDYHVNADDGSVNLKWTPADKALSHVCYFGEDSLQVAKSMGGVARALTYLRISGLSPLKRYFWRVDEEIDGKLYKGKVYSFQPRRLAFPGADGGGKYAIGGRGLGGQKGKVYHVTSLADDPKNPKPGMLRYGISKMKGPRTIVFDVAGIIDLKARLTVSDPYVTIAGQTAPGAGIMLRTSPFGMASDGITRFLRARLGHKKKVNGKVKSATRKYGQEAGTSDETIVDGLDGMGMAGCDQAIMDHCSMGWTIDEAFSSRSAKGITLQNSLISEALNVAGHPNYPEGKAHGFAATIGGGENGGTVGSYHHNLLAHNNGRNWSMSGGLDGSGNYDGHHNIYNNVVYNYVNRPTDGGTHEGNFVGNYYKKGPASRKDINYILQAELEGTGNGTQSYYFDKNIMEGDGKVYTDTATLTAIKLKHNQKVTWQVFTDKPFDCWKWESKVDDARTAYKNVLSDVGCNIPAIDKHDARMINETLRGTYSVKGSAGGEKGMVDSEEDDGCEGFDLEKLGIEETMRDGNWDPDQDGIPTFYEKARGWDPTKPNNNDDEDGNYYTDLEEYLAWAAQPHFMVEQTLKFDLKQYFAGYNKPVYTIKSANGIKAAIKGGSLGVWDAPSGSLTSVEVTAQENGVAMTRTFNFYTL